MDPKDSTDKVSHRAEPDASQRFIASVSHEIRTPLNGILGMTTLLEDTGLTSVQRDYVDAIRKSGSRLLDLLNNVLDYSRLESGELPLAQVSFDPRSLVQDVTELLAPRAHSAGLDLAAASSPKVATRYIGDAGRIRQIIFNLVGNAIKFTEKGGVLTTVNVNETGNLVYSIHDTGTGVPEKDQQRIFSAFGQVSTDDAGRDGGVGLGLAIAGRLAEAMNGEIRLISTPGQGAIFRLRLPLASAPDVKEDVIEDDARTPIYDRPLRIRLQAPHSSEWAVLSALGAEEGQFRRVDRNCDVAILDAETPARTIRAQAKNAPTLVILRPRDRSLIPKFREMGCVGYLIRPLRPASVAERVKLAAAGRDIEDPTDASAKFVRHGARALIADDNPINALLATSALKAAGFAVDTAGSGVEAVEMATNAPYEVIFMDVRMPVMDGLEATRRIRNLDTRTAQAPIIAVTADVDPQLETRAKTAGVDQIAAKPIDPQQMRELALKWAARGRTPS